jgi:hypothetical protein
LRNVAYTVKFTAPCEQKLVSRLLYIAQQEGLSVDRQAVALLYEMHAGDIRSCINALQMISTNNAGKHISSKNLRALAGGTRDNSMSTGLFDVWSTIFAHKPPESSSGKDGKAVTAPKKKAHDLPSMLSAHSSSVQLLINGCHHNYPRAKYTDPRMIRVGAKKNPCPHVYSNLALISCRGQLPYSMRPCLVSLAVLAVNLA